MKGDGGRRERDRDAARGHLARAYELEQSSEEYRRAGLDFLAACNLHDAAEAAAMAAGVLYDRREAEPDRGRACLKAAWLCLDAGRYTLAEAVIEGGLEGRPEPAERDCLAGCRETLYRSDFGRARTLARALRCDMAACNGLPLELMSPMGRRYAIWHMDGRLRDREGIGL